MTGYVIRRILWIIPVLWAVATITFFLMHAVPGGPYCITADSNSHFLYASNQYPSYPTGSVAGYTIDEATGSLTAVPGFVSSTRSRTGCATRYTKFPPAFFMA